MEKVYHCKNMIYNCSNGTFEYNSPTMMSIIPFMCFSAQEWRRNRAQELYMQTIELFLPVEITLDEWTALDEEKKVFSGLEVDALPKNVHIVTLENWPSANR